MRETTTQNISRFSPRRATRCSKSLIEVGTMQKWLNVVPFWSVPISSTFQ